ncbi:MAG: IS4 family transposase [Deltaproteobacteria bacterium]|nr:IS4 family transposase [Deltaproteobacteria bacterium]
MVGNDLRYVARASWNRKLPESEQGIFDRLSSCPIQGKVLLNVPQKGGRQSRKAALEIRSCTLILSSPTRDRALPELKLNVVQVKETVEKDPISWTLLTSEPVETLEQVLYVLRCYSLRWKVEDFHKTWKTGGTNVEGLRLQSEGSLLRAATVLAFVAIRLSQLRDESDPEVLSERTQMVLLSDFKKTKRRKTKKGLTAARRPCTAVLSTLEWQLLWLKVEEGKPLPRKPPNRQWAYKAIGRLAGWYDSKRTGRVGMKTFWNGYRILQELTNAVTLAQIHAITIKRQFEKGGNRNPRPTLNR